MKLNQLFTGLVILLCLSVTFAFIRADDDPIQKIITQLNKWADTYPQEKVYLHTDKPFYAAGEDLWFKAYLTVGEKHELSGLSNVLNVELINDQDSVKRAIKLPVLNGITWGDIALPDSLKAGNYRLRAYTNYMRNAGSEYFFDKTIVIGNSVNNNIFTNVSYQYATQNGQQKVSVAITYTDLNGNPYAGKEVNYEISLNSKDITSGKGITNSHGVLNISFTDKTPAILKPGRIITNIKYADKKTSTQTLLIKPLSDKVDVQFFAEGGSLVNGLRCKVAFKAIGGDGLGIDIKGLVKDNANNDIARLGPSHFGMGCAVFVPESGKTYKAVITMPDGSERSFALPAAADKGYTLSVAENTPGTLTVKIGASKTLVDAGNNVVSIIGQQNGQVYYAAKAKITGSSFAAAIPKSTFPTGIVQFTLFSATNEPLNERLVFVQNPDVLKLDVHTEKQTYAPREKVKIDINAVDASAKPMVGSFSVAVTDETKVPVDETAETTIMSHLLLTSDLKGYIEKPNYYFVSPSLQTQDNLDALMLTQGYRRFVWKQVLSDVFPPPVFQPEKSISIAGILKTSGGKVAPKGKVMLFSTTGGYFMLDTVADEQGRFAFRNLVFKDTARFVLQASKATNNTIVDITLDDAGRPKVDRNRNAPDLQVNVSNELSSYLKNSKSQYLEQLRFGVGDHVTALKEVVITEKKKPLLQNSNNLNGAGNANQIIKSDMLGMCPTLLQCLKGYLTGVIFKMDTAYLSRNYTGDTLIKSLPMLIIIDGMEMPLYFTLNEINAIDVGSVEVLRTPEYTNTYGNKGANGVIIITTKRGENSSFYPPDVLVYKAKGYYSAREFYSPRYDAPNITMADLRTTIFWKPNIITNKQGNASVEFYNADSKGTYRVVIEGIDNDGNLGRRVYRYKVE